MAMQTGIGLSRLLILVGAGNYGFSNHHCRVSEEEDLLIGVFFFESEGYTGTILVKNGKMSDLLGELQVSQSFLLFLLLLSFEL